MLGPMTYGVRSIPLEAASNWQAYVDLLVNDYNASEVFPLVDIASGTTIHAAVNGNRDGVLSGWDLQSVTGPIGDDLAPLSDGANDYGNFYTSNGTDGFADVFDGDVGSIFMWLKVSDAAVWTDGNIRWALILFVDSGNYIGIRRNGNNVLRADFRTSADKSINVAGISTTDWFSMGMSWDRTGADEFKVFFNGIQQGVTQTGLGIWSGTLNNSETVIGARSTTPTLVWNGALAYVSFRLGGIWTPTDFQEMTDVNFYLDGGLAVTENESNPVLT